MQFLKQSTATTVRMGPFVDATDAVTAEDGLTIQKADVRLAIDNDDFTAASADQGDADVGAPHDENGFYEIALDADDTATIGRLRVAISMAGALKVWEDFYVVQYPELIGRDPLGPGALVCTLTVRSTEGAVIADADCWISTDEAGDVVVTGHELTNDVGQVTFLLDSGVLYYLWAEKTGTTFTVPQSFTPS